MAQHILETKHGFLTIYLMLFGVTGVDELAAKFAQGAYRALAPQHSFSDKAENFPAALGTFRPSVSFDDHGQPSITPVKADPRLQGTELLENTMEDLGRFIAKSKKRVILAWTNFRRSPAFPKKAWKEFYGSISRISRPPMYLSAPAGAFSWTC